MENTKPYQLRLLLPAGKEFTSDYDGFVELSKEITKVCIYRPKGVHVMAATPRPPYAVIQFLKRGHAGEKLRAAATSD